MTALKNKKLKNRTKIVPQKKKSAKLADFLCYGGEGGIRTHGSCESPVFKTGSLNHSDTSPCLNDSLNIIPQLIDFVNKKFKIISVLSV